MHCHYGNLLVPAVFVLSIYWLSATLMVVSYYGDLILFCDSDLSLTWLGSHIFEQFYSFCVQVRAYTIVIQITPIFAQTNYHPLGAAKVNPSPASHPQTVVIFEGTSLSQRLHSEDFKHKSLWVWDFFPLVTWTPHNPFVFHSVFWVYESSKQTNHCPGGCTELITVLVQI